MVISCFLPVLTGILCCDSGGKRPRHTLGRIAEPDISKLRSNASSVPNGWTTLVRNWKDFRPGQSAGRGPRLSTGQR